MHSYFSECKLYIHFYVYVHNYVNIHAYPHRPHVITAKIYYVCMLNFFLFSPDERFCCWSYHFLLRLYCLPLPLAPATRSCSRSSRDWRAYFQVGSCAAAFALSQHPQHCSLVPGMNRAIIMYGTRFVFRHGFVKYYYKKLIIFLN